MTASRRAGRPPPLSSDPLWYKDAIFYEVRTRSFFDSNGDGVGDLRGLTGKLDYLADLGVTALWILPHYPSPGRDDGYDIADYTDIDPDVGTLEDFDELIAEAHKRGLRVITELVMNHTSDQHPWFQRARRAAPGSPERDFYVWSDTSDRYREARIIFRDFEPSNWTWDPLAKAYFWHRFFSHQPDLNFDNPAVHEAMLGVVDFWFARGVDGMRLDAVPYLYEQEGTGCENLPATHAFLKKLRAHVDARFDSRMLLAEANQWPEDAAAYFGDGDECHMNFHFPIMPRLFMSIHMEDRFPIIDILQQTPELDASCQWAMFLRNHDELTLEMVTDEERDYMYRAYAHEAQMRINLGIRRRLAPLVGNDRRKMELLNALLLSMPGTPVLYYGDEIGMGDNVYLGDRNGVRTPMQWSPDRNAGFSRANPQKLILPVIMDPEYHYEALNVEAQQSNPNSLLWWTKRLIARRKLHRAFGRGTTEFLHPSNPRVLAFVRRHEDETLLVVANLSRHTQFVELDLSSLEGKIPVEVAGGTKFPPLGAAPYVLTLGGHDCFWFSLEAPREPSPAERMSLHGPPLLVCGSVDDVLSGDERPLLEDALPSYLDARGWLAATGSPRAHIVDVARLGDHAARVVLLFLRVEHDEREPESFVLPVSVLEGDGGDAVIANLRLGDGGRRAIAEAPPLDVARALFGAALEGSVTRGSRGAVVGATIGASAGGAGAGGAGAGAGAGGAGAAGAVPPLAPASLQDARALSSDRFGATISLDDVLVMKLHHRLEEGTAPELEMGRLLAARAASAPEEHATLVPPVVGYVEYRAGRAEAATVATFERYVVNEGTAWRHARSELGRAYERVLARPPGAEPPLPPTEPLVEMAKLDPPGEHRELIGTYRDSAMLLGRRLAELHLALASCRDPAFEPIAYSSLAQRSKYQSARNLVGRELAWLRRSMGELPHAVRASAAALVQSEGAVLARFEPLLVHRIDASQIRVHGDLHLGRVLFTGRDFVIIGPGSGRERRLSERRRKGSALRDVAGLMRSFHYAAAMTVRSLRPEDQERAEPWGWIWQRWASAALLRGYLDASRDAVFVPRTAAMTTLLLDAALLAQAFRELRPRLAERPEMAHVAFDAILRSLGREPPR